MEKRFAEQGGVPILDPVEDMCIEDESFKKTMRRVEAVQARITAHRSTKPQPSQPRALNAGAALGPFRPASQHKNALFTGTH